MATYTYSIQNTCDKGNFLPFLAIPCKTRLLSINFFLLFINKPFSKISLVCFYVVKVSFKKKKLYYLLNTD